MDIHLKQAREQQHESEPSAKLSRLVLHHHQPQPPATSSSALPLFAPTTTLTNLSVFPPDSTTTTTTFSRMGSYFSLGQWHELELQALIFRHMLSGPVVPPQLLHLLTKTLLNSSPSYYPLHHYSHYHQPALLQSGYWGRGAMDPEPGRCKRTDGKKWRCSRDVVAGHKYCERHMHRGRNRSRKPVEIPTSTASTTGRGGGVLSTIPIVAQPLAPMAGGGTHFALSGPQHSFNLSHLNQRPSESAHENKGLLRTQNELSEDDKSGDKVLRHFFDDWPKSVQEPDNTHSNTHSTISSATGLSVSISGNPPSDFSLKLSTGNGDEPGPRGNVEQEGAHLSWGGTWGSNQVASMGGPIAEALRSSTSNSSPTSVLHQLLRASMSTASYAST